MQTSQRHCHFRTKNSIKLMILHTRAVCFSPTSHWKSTKLLRIRKDFTFKNVKIPWFSKRTLSFFILTGLIESSIQFHTCNLAFRTHPQLAKCPTPVKIHARLHPQNPHSYCLHTIMSEKCSTIFICCWIPFAMPFLIHFHVLRLLMHVRDSVYENLP